MKNKRDIEKREKRNHAMWRFIANRACDLWLERQKSFVVEKLSNRYNKRIEKMRPKKQIIKNPKTMHMTIKKNNVISDFDVIVRKNIISDYQKKGFEVIGVQY